MSELAIHSERIVNVPNALTAIRLVCIPFFFYYYQLGYELICLSLLVISFVTDFFDGRVARALGQTTRFGAIFDPIADKLVVLSYFGYLGYCDAVTWWIVTVYFVRNIAQLMSIPVLSWWLKREFKVVPKWPAKWASALSFVLIPLFFFPNIAGLADLLEPLTWVLLVLSMTLEVYVLVTYIPRLVAIALGKHDTFE